MNSVYIILDETQLRKGVIHNLTGYSGKPKKFILLTKTQSHEKNEIFN